MRFNATWKKWVDEWVMRMNEQRYDLSDLYL